MEIEQDNSNDNFRETIIINSDNIPFLNDLNLKTTRNLSVCVDMQKYIIEKYNQIYFTNVIQSLSKAEIIEMNVGTRFVDYEDQYKERQGDWVHFIKGIGKSIKILGISIGENVLYRSNLVQFGKELLRLNHLEKFSLQIGKEKNFGATGYTQLGEALRRMTQLRELCIIIGDYCSLGVNGAKSLFKGMESCEKIGKLKLHIGCFNRLNAEGTQIISSAVGKLKQVSDFYLLIAKTNDIGNEGMQQIDKHILQQHLSKSVEKLSLKIDDMKAIKVENIVQMFSSIGEFAKLQDLSISLGVKQEMKEDSIKTIQSSLKKLTSLLKIEMSINTEPCALVKTPMVDLLTQFSLSNKLVCLQFVIPPQNQFNNSALSLFSMNIKRLDQLKVFSMEIQEYNLEANTALKRKEPPQRNNNKDIETSTMHKEEVIAQTRGISDISESLSSLKQLEKVEWIISAQNDVSDGGWEMLSRSRSLREFRVKIGEGCKLLDEGLRSLSKISNSISLDCLRIEVNNENETSEGGWSNLLSSINLEKMKDLNISVGDYNECSQKSLKQLAVVFERSSPRIEYLTLSFKEFNNISSESIQQLVDSLKSMVYLKQFEFKMPQDLVINSSALNSLSNSIERMIYLQDLQIFFKIQDSEELFNQIKLCSTICSLQQLHHLNLHVEGNECFLNGNTIISKVNPSQQTLLRPLESIPIIQFRTENGLQFKKLLKNEFVSQEYIDKLSESLALLVLMPHQIVNILILIDSMNIADLCPQFTKLISVLSGFNKCVKLKLNFQRHFFSETSLNQLANCIACMPFLSKVSLKLDAQEFSLKAAETLAVFFKNSPRITKVLLMCKFYPNQDQTQREFLLMSSIFTCPNLKYFKVFFESYSQIKLEFKKQSKILDLPLVSLMQDEQEKDVAVDTGEVQELIEPLEESFFYFIIKEGQEPFNYESLIHLGKFLMSTKNLQEINLSVSSEIQISTKIAGIIQEGIMNQSNLSDLHLEFIGKCIVSGEGAVLLSQSFASQRNKNNKTMIIKTDDSFSLECALCTLVSFFNDQNLEIKRDQLKIIGSKFILTTDTLVLSRKYILKIRRPKQIALCQGDRQDQFEAISISQITDKLLELKGISDVDFNASENFQTTNQDWSSFRQLSFLTDVSIQDKSSNTSSRFLSLESVLSQMTHLKSLALTLCHTHENVSSQETIIPFGKCLNNLKELTQFIITFKEFNFGEDGGLALGYGIDGMIALKYLQIKCHNPIKLQTIAIEYLCKVISKSPTIQEFNLDFLGLHSSIEIPCFTLLKNLFQDKQLPSNTSSISVNGEVSQAFGEIQQFAITSSPIVINRDQYFHELQLPSKYCIKSAFEDEAINKCIDILQLYYAFSNEMYSIEYITVNFDFTMQEQIEPNLIFLKTLFSVLQIKNRRVRTLKIAITFSQNDELKLIVQGALRKIELVDTLILHILNPYPYQLSIIELYPIKQLDTLTNLIIMINKKQKQQELQQFRQKIILKMKRLCQYEIVFIDDLPSQMRRNRLRFMWSVQNNWFVCL